VLSTAARIQLGALSRRLPCG